MKTTDIQKTDIQTLVTTDERINLLREHLGNAVNSMRLAAEIFSVMLMGKESKPTPIVTDGQKSSVIIDKKHKVAIISEGVFSRDELREIVAAMGTKQKDRSNINWEQIASEYRDGKKLSDIAKRRNMNSNQLAGLIRYRRKNGLWTEPKRKPMSGYYKIIKT
jgi:hypothetical protein